MQNVAEFLMMLSCGGNKRAQAGRHQPAETGGKSGMSIATGGRSDKLGNRYEGSWVAYKLVQLLAEEVRAVQLEAIGDDEHGVDVWVTRNDGSREAQQCKRKNRTIGNWGLAELARQRVLSALGDQLRRDPTARFTFISSHPAAELREICDTARSAAGNPEAYFAATMAVKVHAENLRRFCAGVGIDSQDPKGRREAFDLLTRTYTHSFDDSPEGRAQVCSLARCHVAGDGPTVVELLGNFAQDNMCTAITTEMVRQHIRDRGLHLVNLAGIPSVSDRVLQLRAEFQESLRPRLINSALVSRSETRKILDLIDEQNGNRLIILHGRAGTGKSCVLLQLTEQFEKMGLPYLPLRLDRRPPQVSAQRYGRDVCDLPESPAVVLHTLYSSQRAVLLVDQLDAMRWTTTHASAQWEACQEMMDEALGFPGLLVIVACRSFDLRDDQQISGWQLRRKGHEVELGELAPPFVAEAVRAAGGDYNALTERQRALLGSPLHLALWTEAHGAGQQQAAWNTHTELLRFFWNSRYEALARLGVPSNEWRVAIETLIAEMEAGGELVAPARVLDQYPKAAPALKSLHIVVESGNRVMFAHQSYFEYQLATRILDQVTQGKVTVAEWIQHGDQSLLRREQLRLVLTLLHDQRPAEYVSAVRQLVTAPAGSIRFHLRQLVLRFVGESPEPSTGERNLINQLVQMAAWRDHVFDQVFSRQPIWFEMMDDAGLLALWLSSGDDALIAAALNLCRWWASRCGERVAGLLRPHYDQAGEWPQRLASVLPFDAADDSPQLFALRLRLIREGFCRHRFLHAEKLAKSHPERCLDLLEAFFGHSSLIATVSGGQLGALLGGL